MNFLKKLFLSISVLAVVNVASAGYDPVTGRFHQQDPLGRGPRIVHTSHGPQWVGTNGPQIRDPRPVAPNPMAGLENIGGNPNMDHAMALMDSIDQPDIHPQVVAQQQYAMLTSSASTAVISIHDAQSHLQTGRWTSQEQFNIPEDQYLDGMNLYQYVRSNPINYVDPYGLLTCDYKVICRKIHPTDWKKKLLRKLNFRHCDLRKKSLVSPKHTVFPVWVMAHPESRTLQAGSGKGCACKCASCDKVESCVAEIQKKYPSGSMWPNCHTQTKRAIDACCLNSTWKPAIFAF